MAVGLNVPLALLERDWYGTGAKAPAPFAPTQGLKRARKEVFATSLGLPCHKCPLSKSNEWGHSSQGSPM